MLFSSDLTLEFALGIESLALALVAGVYFLVLHGTRRRRGRGWLWGWVFTSATVGLECLAVRFPAAGLALPFCAALAASAVAYFTVLTAYQFVEAPCTPRWAHAVLALTVPASLAMAWYAPRDGGIAGAELPLAISTGFLAFILAPSARKAGSGVQTTCIAAIVLALLMFRTEISVLVLGSRHEMLTALYWLFEVIGGAILGFVLAMGEVVALLDDLRGDIQHTNSALERAMRDLEIAASVDPLTGLQNRYAFDTVIAQLRRERALEGSIAILDLNGLKRINDGYGHHAGDLALRHTARRLQEMVRSSDRVFRWGGDEFVLLLFDTPVEVARERLAHMEAPMPLELIAQEPLPLSVSWGVAPMHFDIEAALRQADAHLYEQRRLLRGAAERLGPI